MTSDAQPAEYPHANRNILIGAVAGVAIGLGVAQLPPGSALHAAASWAIDLAGGMFIAALKMVMVPLLFASVAGGIRALWTQRDAGHIWKATLLFFAFTAGLAVTMGIVAANLFQPGVGLPPDLLPAAAAAHDAPDAAGFLRKLLVDSLQNPFRALTEAAVLPLIVSALLLGAAVGQQPQRFATLGRLIDELLDLALVVVGWIMRVAPIGIGALLAKLAATATAAVFGALAKFAAVVLATTLLQGAVVLPLLVWLLAGMPPWRYLKGIRLPMLTALATSSSAATLPVTLRAADRELQIDPAVSRFVIPLGTTVNMDGTALYEAAAALFVAQLAGIDLTLSQQLIVALMAMLAAIGAPGIPSAGMVTMVMVLQSVGLPVEAIALLLPIDRLLDAVRTMVNVQGDLATSLVVQRFTGRGNTGATGSTLKSRAFYLRPAQSAHRPRAPNTGVHMSVQRTLSIIKPDAVAKNVVGQILTRFENAGLKVVAARMMHLSRAEAEQFYGVHRERPFFKDLVDFMISGPVMVQVLEGPDAIAKNRDLMGATDPKKADKGTIRADFADSIDANAVHGSDAPETAAAEIAFFFPAMNIHAR